jgi:hypothetical protein
MPNDEGESDNGINDERELDSLHNGQGKQKTSVLERQCLKVTP